MIALIRIVLTIILLIFIARGSRIALVAFLTLQSIAGELQWMVLGSVIRYQEHQRMREEQR